MVTRNTRYQEGSVERVKRSKGPDAWVYRWRELQADGVRVQKKKVIGDVVRFPTKSAAKKATEDLRAEINAHQDRLGEITVEEAWGHFQLHELRDEGIGRSETTIENYLTLFQAHILPRWGSAPLDQVKAVEVEKWLRGLRYVTPPRKKHSTVPVEQPPLSPSSKAKIKSRMYTLFEHAKRYELCDTNPMETVRQGSKRLRKPDVLKLDEIRALMQEISSTAIRLAVLVAGVTGLRRSEVRGLKWRDIDFQSHWITPTQGSVRRLVTSLKTRASGEPIPIPEALTTAFEEWRAQTPYRADEDWVFASADTSGRSPIWFDSALVRHLRPAAERAKLTQLIGWHTFRRSLATLLTSKREAVKVVQELMRHADPRITLELYAQGEEEAKRAAQEHVRGLFIVEKRES
jgi:integrase